MFVRIVLGGWPSPTRRSMGSTKGFGGVRVSVALNARCLPVLLRAAPRGPVFRTYRSCPAITRAAYNKYKSTRKPNGAPGRVRVASDKVRFHGPAHHTLALKSCATNPRYPRKRLAASPQVPLLVFLGHWHTANRGSLSCAPWTSALVSRVLSVAPNKWGIVCSIVC